MTSAPRRLVIAEDEALIRLDLAEMLVEEGYEVVGQAADGEQAIALARDLHPDVVMLDVKMPRLDGISAAEVITAERLSAVLMLTAFSQRELVERALQAGAMAYLVKPFTQSDLVPAIETAAARFDQIRTLEAEVDGLAGRLRARTAIDRAKSILQQQLGLSEPDAFRWIQKTAMDLRLSMSRVAESVVAEGPAFAPGRDTDETR